MAALKFPNLFSINLLINRGRQEKLSEKFLKWALSSGKFIVIIVEMITISAFIYRYKLDADLVDLQEKINDKIPYIKSLSHDEIQIKDLQFRLSTISKLKSEKVNLNTSLAELTKIIPKSIFLTNINFDRSEAYPKTSFSITGQTPSNLELSLFMKELQKNPNFSNISLSNISFENQTVFTITGNIL